MKRLYAAAPAFLLFSLLSFTTSAQIVKIDSLSPWKKKLNFGINVNL